MRGRPWPLRYTVPGIILGGGALIVIAASIHQFATTTRRGVEQLREHALFVATTAAAEIEADGRAGAPSRWAGTVHRLANDRRLRLGRGSERVRPESRQRDGQFWRVNLRDGQRIAV